MIITLYDVTTGGALYTTEVADEAQADACRAPGQGWHAGLIDPAIERIDPATGDVAPLLEFDLTIATNLLAGIPAGTTALWKLDKAVIDDGSLEFETDGLPEDVRVRLTHPAYHPVAVTVPCA